MTYTILLFGSFIILAMVLRPFLYKPAAKYFPADMSSAFTSAWMVFGILLTFPFLYKSFNWNLLIEHPTALLLSIFKGVVVYLLIKFQQIINKDSTSSSVFFLFMAFACGSLLNNLFFGENLPLTHLIAIMGFGVLGISYFFKGDLKRLSLRGKIYFCICVCLVTYTMVSDHVVIRQISWYPHLVVSNLAMFIMALTRGISKQDYKNMVANPQIALAGFVYTASEFLIIYCSINVMPVSYVALFMRLAAPIVMIISAKKYGEQSVLNQAIFGGIAFALAAVVIFF